jgi:hypothetical protein
MAGYPWDPDDPIKRMLDQMKEITHVSEAFRDQMLQADSAKYLLAGSSVSSDLAMHLTNSGILAAHSALEPTWVGEHRRLVAELEQQQRQAAEAARAYQLVAGPSALSDLAKEFAKSPALVGEQLGISADFAATFVSPSLEYAEVLRQASIIGDIFLNHQKLIQAYVHDTIYVNNLLTVSLSGQLSQFSLLNRMLVRSYDRVSTLIETGQGGNIGSSARPMPTIEVFASAEVVEELAVTASSNENSTHQEEEAGSRDDRRKVRQELQQAGSHQLGPAIEALDPRLRRMWEGSSLAISSANPDRIRHFCVSRRELMTHVLHRLAPDEEIRKWNTSSELYDKGRPTRTARLRYICRSIESFQPFVRIDYALALQTLDLFQKGTHSLEANFTPEQLLAASTRADQQLLFLLLLGKTLI